MSSYKNSHGSSGQFPHFSQGNFSTPTNYSDQNTYSGGVYYQPTSGYLPQHNHVTQQGQPIGFQVMQTDPRQLYKKRKEGLTKLRNVGVFNIILSTITIIVGVATLAVASKNIGFPVFNFGVLLVGILHMFSGVLCFRAAKNGLESISESHVEVAESTKCYIIGQFVLSVTNITFAILAAVFAFLSGAVCSGADIQFRSRNNNEVRDLNVEQYCEPNNDGNTALAFVGGALCVLIAVMCIYGSAWVCCYGLAFGWRRRRSRLTAGGIGFAGP